MIAIEAIFEGGQVVMTQGVNINHTEQEVLGMLKRHFMKDWGDLCEEDQIANEEALEKGDRILSAYGDCYVITEADRSYTTVLLKEEY